MTTPITNIPKLEAKRFKDARKVFLVPIYIIPPGISDEGDSILERYWTEVRDHLNNLESSLGKTAHIFHEAIFDAGDEGMKAIEILNLKAYPLIQEMSKSGGKLEATEDKMAVHESSDWQRCLSVGLLSEKVSSTALNGYQDSTTRRYEYISNRIDTILKPDSIAVLFIREDHRVQFPTDMQIFYIAPPSLESLKQWLDDQFRKSTDSDVDSEQTS